MVFPRLFQQGQFDDVQYVIADKGYDTGAVRSLIREAEKTPVIPRRKNAYFSGLLDEFKPLYHTRSAIERFFGAIKENKRLVMRFDKLDSTFFAFFAIACIKALKLIC